jgi:orotate phosphoribosyltransferase
VREVLEAVKACGAEVAGIGVLVDRAEKEPDFGYPLYSCLRTVTPAYKPEDCPQCRRGIPLVKLGSSKQPQG